MSKKTIITLVLGLLALGGCGSGSSTTTSSPAAVAVRTDGPVRIVMQSLAFNPPVVRASVGQRVVWINADNAVHNVTYISGPRFTSSRRRLVPGNRFSIKIPEAGTIRYYCSLHPWMKGTILVTP